MASLFFVLQWVTLAALALSLLLLLGALVGKRSYRYRWLIIGTGLASGAIAFAGFNFHRSVANGVFPKDSSLAMPLFFGLLSILLTLGACTVLGAKSVDMSGKQHSLTSLLLLTALVALQIAISQIGVEVGSYHQAEFWESFEHDTDSAVLP